MGWLSEFDKGIISEHVHAIMRIIGAHPDFNPGLKDTPRRVANMIDEVFEGMRYSNSEISELPGINKCFDIGNNNLVVEKEIQTFSYCEHHLALMYNMTVAVGYIPNKKVIGLSKIARIVDLCSKRLQLQERLGEDIMQVLSMVLNTADVIVVIEGEHSCMTARGIRKPGTKTKTASLDGVFKDDSALRSEFYSLIN